MIAAWMAASVLLLSGARAGVTVGVGGTGVVGAVAQLGVVWRVSDTLNAFMAFPNLVSLVLLSPVVAKVTKDYFDRREATIKKPALVSATAKP